MDFRSFLYLSYNLSGFYCVAEDHMAVIFQGTLQNQSDHTAGKYFTDADCQHHKRDRQIDTVSVVKDERYDQGVGNDRRQRS